MEKQFLLSSDDAIPEWTGQKPRDLIDSIEQTGSGCELWVEPSRPLQSHGKRVGLVSAWGFVENNVLEAIGVIGPCIEVMTGQMIETRAVQGVRW
jgi:hypothetical protein